MTHVQEFSSGILIIFLLENVWYLKESGVMCGSRSWLTCTILVYRSRLYTDFRLISLKCLSNLPKKSVSYEKPYFMQFFVSACELCMLGCVLLDSNGTKWTGNALSIPAAACSQQLLRRNKLPTGCLCFLFWSFQAMIWMYLWQIWL